MTTRSFEGRFNVRLNKEAGAISLTKAVDGKFGAEHAEDVAKLVVEAAKKHKASLDRWSFYIKGVSQNLGDSKVMAATEVAKALKAGHKPVIKAGKWGKPRLDLVNPDAPSAKSNDNIVTL